MVEQNDRQRAMEAIQGVFDRFFVTAKARDFNGFDIDVVRALKLVDAGPEGYAAFEFTVEEKFSNINDVLHGGAAATVFDMCTTFAIAPLTKPGYWEFLAGVTRSLNVSYLRAIPKGTTIRIEAKVEQLGKTMALITGKITSLDGKTIYTTCEQHKVHMPPHMREGEKWVDGKIVKSSL